MNELLLYNIPRQHIQDYFGYALQAGIRTGDDTKVQGDFKAGILTSIYEHKRITDGHITATAFSQN